MLDSLPSLDGAHIVMASSNDSRFPPDNILDGKPDTFWVTTGIYPQSFVLALPGAFEVKSMTMQCYNVKDLQIEKTIKEDPVEFEEIHSLVLDSTNGTLQKMVYSPSSCEARFLRFVIKSGYDHFCAVYKLFISGSTL